MATYTWTSILDQSTNANFQQWVNEVYTALVTQLGLVQTADTGQMAVPCATAAPGASNTVAGYYIFRFNDSLQGSSPVFFKLEFGSGAAALDPHMSITVGTGSNGTGTITCTGFNQQPGRLMCSFGNHAGNTSTNYTSYACWVPAQGILWMGLKRETGHTLTTYGNFWAGFQIHRSVNNAGNPTATSVTCYNLYSNGPATTFYPANSSANYFVIGYNTNTLYGPGYTSTGTPAGSATSMATALWSALPFSATATQINGIGQLGFAWQYVPTTTAPPFGITNAMAVTINAGETPALTTFPSTVLGVVSLTYMNVGILCDAYQNGSTCHVWQ